MVLKFGAYFHLCNMGHVFSEIQVTVFHNQEALYEIQLIKTEYEINISEIQLSGVMYNRWFLNLNLKNLN